MKKEVLVECEDFLNTYKIRPKHYNFKPIYYSDDCLNDYAYLIGKIMGDGNLDSKYTCRFIGQKEDLIQLKELIIHQFQIPNASFAITERYCKGHSYLLQVNNSSFGRVLAILGAPIGNKTKNSVSIPNWINRDNIFQKSYLQAILEDEMSTIKIQKANYSIKPRIKLSKKSELMVEHKKFMLELKRMIESFGIICSNLSKPNHIKTYNSIEIYFDISRKKENIIKFKEKIGFRFNKNKIVQLEKTYKILKNSI